MTLKPFKELIAMTAEAKDKALAPIRARSAKAQADLELCKLDEKLATLEAGIQEKCTGKTIDFPKLLDSLDEIALIERRKKQYKKVLDELFPD